MRKTWVAVLGGVLLAACTQFEIKVEKDPAAYLAGHRTWALLPEKLLAPADQRLPDPYLGRKLIATVDRVLAAKGYQHAAEDQADLWVNYRLTRDARTNI